MWRTNDFYKAHNPADEFLGPDPEAEEELPEPEITEEWDGGRAEYVTTCTFANRAKYTVRLSAFPDDTYEIVDAAGAIISDGHVTPERALDRLLDLEENPVSPFVDDLLAFAGLILCITIIGFGLYVVEPEIVAWVAS